MVLAVIGLGKLGLCTAACFASRGFTVWGHDANPEHMAALSQGQAPLAETGLPELMDQARPNLRWAGSIAQAVNQAAITFIIVPTPSLPGGRFDNSYVEKVLAQVGPALKGKSGYPVVAVVSTVMPGSSTGVFQPLMEELSGRRCGVDFGLAYNPEFIALGSVIRDFLNPDMVLIGSSDQRAGEMVRRVYQMTCATRPHFGMMSLINAEITKLSLNCFVTMKISFANELAALCARVPGASVDEVTRALGADTRIGARCLTGGLGFGGPCFPRDNLAFMALAAQAGWQPKLSPRVVEMNQAVVEDLAATLLSEVPAGGKVAILGVSYKAGTHIVEESQSLLLAQRLIAAGRRVCLHDPAALDEAARVLGPAAEYAHDPAEAAREAQALVLMTDWPQYRELNWQRLAHLAAPDALVIDSWRRLHPEQLPGLRLRALGVGPAEESPAPAALAAAG